MLCSLIFRDRSDDEGEGEEEGNDEAMPKKAEEALARKPEALPSQERGYGVPTLLSAFPY
jgi:hypothetical protein